MKDIANAALVGLLKRLRAHHTTNIELTCPAFALMYSDSFVDKERRNPIMHTSKFEKKLGSFSDTFPTKPSASGGTAEAPTAPELVNSSQHGVLSDQNYLHDLINHDQKRILTVFWDDKGPYLESPNWDVLRVFVNLPYTKKTSANAVVPTRKSVIQANYVKQTHHFQKIPPEHRGTPRGHPAAPSQPLHIMLASVFS